ncbi:PAS domain S-box protein [Nitrospira defluvii]|nr:PAS domain S-box protein [Nitrospira defluvii]
MLISNKKSTQGRLFTFTSFGTFLFLILALLSVLFLKISIVLTPASEETTGDVILLLVKVFSVAGIGLFIFSRFQKSLLNRVTGEIQASQHRPSKFVINTFEGLIQELKAKEEALEILKKAAEDHAVDIESYNENILQSVPSGVLTFNCEKIITTFNPAAEMILDLLSNQVLEKSYETVFEDNPKMVHLLNKTLESAQNILRQDCMIEQVTGKKMWLGLSTSLLRDRHEKIIGATLVFSDLTEKKMLEEQVELKKRLVMMGEMSAWVAHEFRSYMGTILGFARLLEKKLDEGDERQPMVASITDELLSMEHLISELLSYSKKTVIEPTPTLLTDLLRRIKDQFDTGGEYPEINWDLSFEDNFPEIKLDQILLRQSFTNLIQNALDAMEGCGRLTIKAFFRRTAKRVQIEISDTGDGILAEDLHKVFLPFFTTKTKGTGLGLALVHKIILAHNGHITVENQQKKGTLFTIILPIKPEQTLLKEPEWKQF